MKKFAAVSALLATLGVCALVSPISTPNYFAPGCGTVSRCSMIN